MTRDCSVEVSDIRQGTPIATDVMCGHGHVVREEADGVFDGGL